MTTIITDRLNQLVHDIVSYYYSVPIVVNRSFIPYDELEIKILYIRGLEMYNIKHKI